MPFRAVSISNMPKKRGPHRKEADGLVERTRTRGPDHAVVRKACVQYWDRDVRAMAKAIGKSRPAVHHWITGLSAVDGEDLERIAIAAGTTVEALRASAQLDDAAAIQFRGRRLHLGEPGYEAIAMLLDRLFEAVDEAVSRPRPREEAEMPPPLRINRSRLKAIGSRHGSPRSEPTGAAE